MFKINYCITLLKRILSLRNKMEIKFNKYLDADTWLENIQVEILSEKFKQNGYAIIENYISEINCLRIYQDCVSKMHSGAVDTKNWRHDLGSHQPKIIPGVENTGQIMWPSDRIKGLKNGPLHERGLVLSKSLLGKDLEFDFDMLIFKDPLTGGKKKVNEKITSIPNQLGETPWHQDESYWPSGLAKIKDKSKLAKIFPGRSITIWLALDDITERNGCLWFIPGSHKKKLRNHRTASKNSHVLTTDEIEEVFQGRHILSR